MTLIPFRAHGLKLVHVDVGLTSLVHPFSSWSWSPSCQPNTDAAIYLLFPGGLRRFVGSTVLFLPYIPMIVSLIAGKSHSLLPAFYPSVLDKTKLYVAVEETFWSHSTVRNHGAGLPSKSTWEREPARKMALKIWICQRCQRNKITPWDNFPYGPNASWEDTSPLNHTPNTSSESTWVHRVCCGLTKRVFVYSKRGLVWGKSESQEIKGRQTWTSSRDGWT